MTSFALQRIKSAFVFVLVVSGAGSLSGCSRKACFAWSAAEGACPSSLEARTFFGDCNDILSIDSEGSFSDDLCCYDVTKSQDAFAVCATPDGHGGGFGGLGGAAPGDPGNCDTIGVCGQPSDSGCLNCAFNHFCHLNLNACIVNTECNSILTCSHNCPVDDTVCLEGCGNMFPGGVNLYRNLVACVVCDICATSCSTTPFAVPVSCESSTSSGMGGMSGAGGAGGMSGMGGMSGAGGAP